MDKEYFENEFRQMIKESWTFQRMTREEQERCLELLEAMPTKEVLKGTIQQRWKILQAIYNAYLKGLGYTGFAWREEEENPKF